MIKDSGQRKKFKSGAVRDIQKGKGRCDLLPLDVVANSARIYDENTYLIFLNIEEYKKTGNYQKLYKVLYCFFAERKQSEQGIYNLFLELSKHFEQGAEKYGEGNWEKGIPTKSYIDSATRHYLKWKRGDKDENHSIAFCWNIICCIWTCENKPEFNSYLKGEKHETNELEKN